MSRAGKQSMTAAWLTIVTLLFAVFLFGVALIDKAEAQSINHPLQPVVPKYFETDVPIIVIVHTFRSELEVREAFDKEVANGKYPKLTKGVMAFSMQGRTPDGVQVCEVWAASPITFIDDRWYAMGHEFGHCIWGQWHLPERRE